MGNKKILFIGTGVMAEGIIKEILADNKVKAENIIINNRTSSRMLYLNEIYGVTCCHSAKEGINAADVIIIGVKPQDLEDVLTFINKCENKKAVIVSIAAGKSISFIEKYLGVNAKIIRVMPNSMVEVKKGFSALCQNESVSSDEFNFVENLMKSIGDTVVIKEALFDAFTGFSCSGPAYVYEFMEAMIDSGVYAGISRADSTKFTIENILGACEMVKTCAEHPAVIKERMTSPGGTTITGLKVLNEAGFKGMIQNAVSSAVERSREL
jgi:pyrroline-5-carboxylate reductase